MLQKADRPTMDRWMGMASALLVASSPSTSAPSDARQTLRSLVAKTHVNTTANRMRACREKLRASFLKSSVKSFKSGRARRSSPVVVSNGCVWLVAECQWGGIPAVRDSRRSRAEAGSSTSYGRADKAELVKLFRENF